MEARKIPGYKTPESCLDCMGVELGVTERNVVIFYHRYAHLILLPIFGMGVPHLKLDSLQALARNETDNWKELAAALMSLVTGYYNPREEIEDAG